MTYMLLLIAVVIWGSTFVATKICLEHMSTLQLARTAPRRRGERGALGALGAPVRSRQRDLEGRAGSAESSHVSARPRTRAPTLPKLDGGHGPGQGLDTQRRLSEWLVKRPALLYLFRPQSCRSVTMGSMRAARRAGTLQATVAETASHSVTNR